MRQEVNLRAGQGLLVAAETSGPGRQGQGSPTKVSFGNQGFKRPWNGRICGRDDRVAGKIAGAAPVVRPLDPLTPVHRVEQLPAGEPVGDADLVARWRLEGAVVTAAFLVGAAEACTDLSVAYAKERRQFDRPIGSFQAVKHLLADMLVRAEVARASVHAAACTLDDPDVGDVARAVAGAKMLAGDAAITNGKTATQVHGGMGFTWEVDVHLYLKRAWVLDTVLGSVDEHADAVAATIAG